MDPRRTARGLGTISDGDEDSLSLVHFPSELHIDTEFELITPDATLRPKDPYASAAN